MHIWNLAWIDTGSTNTVALKCHPGILLLSHECTHLFFWASVSIHPLWCHICILRNSGYFEVLRSSGAQNFQAEDGQLDINVKR